MPLARYLPRAGPLAASAWTVACHCLARYLLRLTPLPSSAWPVTCLVPATSLTYSSLSRPPDIGPVTTQLSHVWTIFGPKFNDYLPFFDFEVVQI